MSILPEDGYESMVETLHLLKSPANAARLMRAVKNADAGKLSERETVKKPAR